MLMKTSSLFIFLCVIQDSDAYSKTAFTLELNVLTVVAIPMILDFHNLSIALKTVLAFPNLAILASTSCSVPHLHFPDM